MYNPYGMNQMMRQGGPMVPMQGQAPNMMGSMAQQPLKNSVYQPMGGEQNWAQAGYPDFQSFAAAQDAKNRGMAPGSSGPAQMGFRDPDPGHQMRGQTADLSNDMLYPPMRGPMTNRQMNRANYLQAHGRPPPNFAGGPMRPPMQAPPQGQPMRPPQRQARPMQRPARAQGLLTRPPMEY